MSPARKILVVDPDPESARHLARSLRERDYTLHAAADGSRALEVAVLRRPDLVLFDESSPLLDARTFIQILRTNPRTDDVPVIVTGTGHDLERLRGYRDGYLRKPFNLDEVLSRIEQIFRRAEAAKALKAEASEIEGSLKQMGIADLLQILASNRRTGRVALESGRLKGEILLSEGRPVNARSGSVDGEKALFRLLAWREGSFSFTPSTPSPSTPSPSTPSPGEPASPPRIQRGMEDALLEGMRQSDEADRLLTRLPPPPTLLALAADREMSQDLHPITAQVVAALAEPRALREILDRCPATDFEVMAAVAALLEKGLAVQVSPSRPADDTPLLQPAELHALRARLARGRQASSTVGKLLVVGQPRSVGRFARGLARMPRFTPDAHALTCELGALGYLHLPDGLSVEILAVPGGEESRPLWRPFGAGAVVAVLLDESGLPLANAFASTSRTHLMLAGAAAVPTALRRAIGGASLGPSDPIEAVRTALALAAQPAMRSS